MNEVSYNTSHVLCSFSLEVGEKIVEKQNPITKGSTLYWRTKAVTKKVARATQNWLDKG